MDSSLFSQQSPDVMGWSSGQNLGCPRKEHILETVASDMECSISQASSWALSRLHAEGVNQERLQKLVLALHLDCLGPALLGERGAHVGLVLHVALVF